MRLLLPGAKHGWNREEAKAKDNKRYARVVNSDVESSSYHPKMTNAANISWALVLNQELF